MVTLSKTAQSFGQPTAWHSLDSKTALKLLESEREQGLSAAGLQERTAQFGSNELEEKPWRSRWQILLD
jgi:Ca2+-transporting ATPase